MTVSIRSVLHNTQFKRADPVVEVEGKDLDTPVRWVFTNEREDVSSFLSGGEMLIIEGNALLAADWHGTLGQYVASLAQAGVAALVVELVEGVVRMPDELVSAARLHGLTLIGLKSRVPFVDICQSVNTAIVHEQMHLQLEVDTMSTSLREGLSRTGNIEAVAETIASLFGESVAIFDGDGLLAARAGRAFDAGNESSAVIALESRSRPVGALEITQRTMTFDATMRRAIATIVSPVAASPLLLDTLCVCFDNLDSKTGACEQLGIRRQTLYNRLDKVTQMVGVDYNDKPNWSMLLFAAKLTKSWQEQHVE